MTKYPDNTRAGSIVAVDAATAIGKLNAVDPNGELVRAAKAIGIAFGD